MVRGQVPFSSPVEVDSLEESAEELSDPPDSATLLFSGFTLSPGLQAAMEMVSAPAVRMAALRRPNEVRRGLLAIVKSSDRRIITGPELSENIR